MKRFAGGFRTGLAAASIVFATGSIAPAQAFIVPGTTPTSTSPYSQYQSSIYSELNPWISIDQVSYGVGTGIETPSVNYSGQYDSTVTGVFGLWQVGNPAELTPGGGLNFWANTGNNPVLSLSFGTGSSMTSYLGVVSRRVTDGSTVESFMWTRIDEDAYWNAYDPATYMSTVINPSPATEQYLLWVTDSPADPINGPQQVNSAPVLASLQAELGDQIAAGTGGTAPSTGGGGSASGGGASGGGGGQNVPGPLPLLGLGAAFGWARRLRRVVRAARS